MALRHRTAILLLLLGGCVAAPQRSPPDRLDDPALHAALRSVLCRVDAYCGVLQLQLLDRATEQAEMYPDDRLRLHLGLLLATRNESEVAFILAHETAHRRLRHRPARNADERLRLELAADADAAQTLQRAGWPAAAAVGASLLGRLLDASRQRADALPASATGERAAPTGHAEDIEQMTARIAALRRVSTTDTAAQPAPLADWNALLAPYRATAGAAAD